MQNLKRIALLLSFTVIVLELFRIETRAQEKIKFPVGVGTKTVGTNMFWLGVKKGFIDEAGMDVQPILLRGGPITMQALFSESLAAGDQGARLSAG